MHFLSPNTSSTPRFKNAVQVCLCPLSEVIKIWKKFINLGRHEGIEVIDNSGRGEAGNAEVNPLVVPIRSAVQSEGVRKVK